MYKCPITLMLFFLAGACIVVCIMSYTNTVQTGMVATCSDWAESSLPPAVQVNTTSYMQYIIQFQCFRPCQYSQMA